MKRRHFIQSTSSLLASLGLSQLDVLRQASRYAQVLAQDTPRKLALLVGINAYDPALNLLQGCLTDVEMQRQLLINRFRFNPKDIIEVTNTQATRKGILEAFEQHLIKQAKPGDVVVFHYSGHGSRVRDPEPIEGDPFNSTMVPIDRPGKSATSSEDPVSDIMGSTLFLLMSAVQTDNITVVLDSCHSGGGKRGNIVVRAARKEGDGVLNASQEEFDYQKRWLSQLGFSQKQVHELRSKGVAKGVVIASAKRDQSAADAMFEGFHAGAFTYVMTQYLWHESRKSSYNRVFEPLALLTKERADQNPEFEEKPGSNNKSKPIYFLETTRPTASGVVRTVDGNQVEYWLGGLASSSLAGFDKGNAVFTIIDDQGQERGQIKQESRDGLVGKGTVINTAQPGIVQPGTLLLEQVRGIPADLKLRIGVDETLSGEKAQAQAALQRQKRIEPVSAEQRTVADYLLGRVTQKDLALWQQQKVSNLPPVGSVGLFTDGKKPLPGSFDQAGESAENAVQRLRSRLTILLVKRILNSLVNGDSSKLNIDVSIKSLDGRGTSGTVRSRGTRSAQSTLLPGASNTQNPQFKRGTNIQAQVKNNESRQIYVSLLYITGSTINNFFPLDWDAAVAKSLVAPGQTITVPQPEDNFIWNVGDKAGTFEVLILASMSPLSDALKGLQNLAKEQRNSNGNPLRLPADKSVESIGNLLGDINNNSRSGEAEPKLLTKEVQAISTKQLAAISIVVEVVD